MKRNKIICMLMAFFLIVSTSSPVYASNKGANKQDLIEKLSVMVPLLCENVADVCYLGEQLSAYRVTEEGSYIDAEYELYPVFSGGKIIALAQVLVDGQGNEQVSCVSAFSNNLQTNYAKAPDAEIAVFFALDGVYIAQNNNVPVKIYDVRNDDLGVMPKQVMSSKGQEICYKKINTNASFIPQINSTRALQYMTLNVRRVPNDSVGCTNSNGTGCDSVGLCWAACIAMIVNYYRGTSHTTSTIHTRTGCMSYGSTATDYKNELRDFGMYVYGPYSTFTYNNIVSLTQADCLAFMRIERSFQLDGQTQKRGHMIVPYGYYYNPDTSSSKFFYYMDPNSGGGIAEFPTSGTLYIATNGRTYYFDYYIKCDW